MTCSAADKSCPLVEGAIARYAIHYTDPRLCDDTPTETASKSPARTQRMAAKAATKAKHKKSAAHRLHRFTSGLNRAFLVFLGLEESKAVTSPSLSTLPNA